MALNTFTTTTSVQSPVQFQIFLLLQEELSSCFLLLFLSTILFNVIFSISRYFKNTENICIPATQNYQHLSFSLEKMFIMLRKMAFQMKLKYPWTPSQVLFSFPQPLSSTSSKFSLYLLSCSHLLCLKKKKKFKAGLPPVFHKLLNQGLLFVSPWTTSFKIYNQTSPYFLCMQL